MNLASNLEKAAFYFPDRPALSENYTETTYKQLNNRANRIATALIRMGIKPGDLIGLCAPNSTDWIAFYFGVIKAGAVAVTLAYAMKSDELSLLVNHSRSRMMFTADDKIDDLERLRGDECLEKIICPGGDISLEKLMETGTDTFEAMERDRNDTAAILYTGGTTGNPKGVMLTHENINSTILTVVYDESSNEKDRALCFLPFNHVFGQNHIMNSTILSAGCLEVMPSFDMERVLDLLSSGRVTKLFSVPTVFIRLLGFEGLKEKLGSVRYCFSAAASMAADVVRQWKEQTGLSIHEGYGMTETAPCVSYNHHYRHVIGSVGTEVPGVEVHICDQEGNVLEQGDEGEICIRGRNVMKGYLNNPEGTREAFWGTEWFRSGDVGVFDENGYLYIVDRLKDMIITGGENVYSREVEDVLYQRPDIQECAVIGLPDKEWGERVTAVLIPKSGKTLDENQLKTDLKSRLASYKVPKKYIVVDDFPRSPAGKILKRELKKQYTV